MTTGVEAHLIVCGKAALRGKTPGKIPVAQASACVVLIFASWERHTACATQQTEEILLRPVEIGVWECLWKLFRPIRFARISWTKDSRSGRKTFGKRTRWARNKCRRFAASA